jgi:hypothetical protein
MGSMQTTTVLKTVEEIFSKEAESITHFQYTTRRYTEEGIQKNNGRARCVLEFEDFHAGGVLERLIEEARRNPKLVDAQMYDIVGTLLKALGSTNNMAQQADPNMFHNTFLVINDLPLLQLRNKVLLEELQKLNDEFLRESEPIEEVKLMDQRRKIKLGLASREDFWEPLVQKKIMNNVYVLNHQAALPTSFEFVRFSIIATLTSITTLGVLYFVQKHGRVLFESQS